MPVSYTVDTGQQLIVTRCEGDLTAEDLRKLLDAQFADERARQAFRHLLDVRATNVPTISGREVWSLAEHVRECLGRHPAGSRFRTALLASHPVAVGLAWTFSTLSAGPGQMAVFTDPVCAWEWLGAVEPRG